MLPKSLVTALEKKLGINEVGGSPFEVEVNKTLLELANNNLYQNDRDVQQRLDN